MAKATEKKIKVSELIPDDKNFNKGSEFGNSLISKSFEKFGAGRSILIDKNNKIIAGNKSTENYGAGGGEDVIVVESDGTKLIAVKRTDIDLDTPEGRELALADNATAKANIVWAEDVIASELGVEVGESWGVDMGKEIPEAVEDDFDTTPPEEPKTVLGDLYEIGEHRLLCGDSTDSDAVGKLMNGEKADMVFTDPPYNVGFSGQELSNTTKNGKAVLHHKGANTKHDKIKNDELDDSDFNDFMDAILSNVLLFNKGAWYFCFCDLKLDLLLKPLRVNGFEWKSIIVWKKNQATLSAKDYKSCYEPIVYGCPPNSFYGERYKQEDVWEFQRTLKNDLHPTMKPIALIENAVKNSSRDSDTVLDLFLGSGSTMVASHQLKRKCYGMELDCKYCDVIVKRMITLDQTLTIKLNGVDVTNEWKS